MSILLRNKKNVYQELLLSETKYVQISKFTPYTKCDLGKFLIKATLARNSVMNE